ncbi:unnamed protein product, partial [Nesidiocoris tenuis]
LLLYIYSCKSSDPVMLPKGNPPKVGSTSEEKKTLHLRITRREFMVFTKDLRILRRRRSRSPGRRLNYNPSHHLGSPSTVLL